MATKTVTMQRRFYDCEHGGDIDEIKTIIWKNGGKITHEEFNYDAEQLYLEWEVSDAAKFRESVKGEYWFGQ